jgi:membrane protease YdiL (CAAX protease family)
MAAAETIPLRGERQAWHGFLFLTLLGLTSLTPPGSKWPWCWLLPTGAYALATAAIPALRQSRPRLRPGRINARAGALTLAIALLSLAVLTSYQRLVHPDVARLAERLPLAGPGGLLACGFYFSIVNATLEELIFRGILFEAIRAEWGRLAALAATGALFGFGHLHGYPPGWFGAILAGAYGLLLGCLRLQSGGLLLPFAAHVVADATIFAIVAGV